MPEKISLRIDARVSHQAWFAALIRNPERADDFLRRHLPAGVVAQLADSLPERLPTGHLTPVLGERDSDHMFLLKLKDGVGPSHLVVILEHQSTVDLTMARRTCVYEALTAHGMKECGLPEDLPIVVVIAYHGRRNWTAKLNRENMNPAKGAIARLRSTRHRYYLCDLYRMSERKMAEDAVLRAGLSMSTCAYRKSVTVEEIARLLEPFPSGSQLEEMALAYIIRLPASFATLVEGVRRAKSRRGVEIMESVYESLSRKIDLGQKEGRVRMMLVMLKGRFGELPAAVVSQVKAATPEQLDEWAAELLVPGRAERLFRHWIGNGRSPAH